MYKTSPKGNFNKEVSDTEYTDVCTVTLENGETTTFYCFVRIYNGPVIDFSLSENGEAWLQDITIEETVTLYGSIIDRDNILADDPGAYFKWSIPAGEEYAGFLVGDSTETVAEVDHVGLSEPVRLYGKAPGIYGLRVDLMNSNGGKYAGRGAGGCRVITDHYDPVDDKVLNDAEDALKNGKEATIDIPAKAALGGNDFKKLKDAAKDGANVTLKHQGKDELTLAFDPSAVSDDWDGAFTPSFTPAIPDKAAEQGFSPKDGKWVQFAFSGELPAPMTVTMKVSPTDFMAGGDQFKVWYYDEDTGALKVVETAVTYDKAAGTISFTLTHFSTYAIFPESIDPNVKPEKPSIGGGSSGGGGGGGGGSVISGATKSSTVTASAATKAATKAVEDAIEAAANAGAKSVNASVTFKDVKSMTPDIFKSINASVAKASKGSDIAVKTTVQIDTTVNGKLTARMYIDPLVAAGLKAPIKTTVDVSPTGKDNKKVAAIADKHFDNNAAVVSFAQDGAFGMSIPVAVKVDTSKLDTKTLMFYSYDAKTNSFNVIPAPAHFIDTAGYVHFATTVGGSIVITDRPMTKK